MPLAPVDLDRARSIDLLDYLKQLGHRPVTERPSYALFHSPLRDDRHPSFSVTFFKGRWYWKDFATQDHGDAITFAQRYFQCSFQDAVSHLLHHRPIVASPPAPRSRPTPPPSSIERVRAWYRRAHAHQDRDRSRLLRYFHHHHLPFDPRYGAVVLSLRPDPHKPAWRLPYVAFPVPTAEVSTLCGLECRALYDAVPRAYRKRAFGQKTFWHFRRPGAPTLITESITDCLSADRLFGPVYDLLALNTIHNVGLLHDWLTTWSPPSIILALDNDHPDRGPKAQHRALELLRPSGLPVYALTVHHHARVKDLHRLLLRAPDRRIDPHAFLEPLTP